MTNITEGDALVKDRLSAHTYFEPNTGCWIWMGTWDKDGYGKVHFRGQTIRVHQASFALFQGRLRRGREIDHTCNIRACWNPAHLEDVSRACNCRRIFSRRKAAAA